MLGRAIFLTNLAQLEDLIVPVGLVVTFGLQQVSVPFFPLSLSLSLSLSLLFCFWNQLLGVQIGTRQHVFLSIDSCMHRRSCLEPSFIALNTNTKSKLLAATRG
jgi:hypothetical protein